MIVPVFLIIIVIALLPFGWKNAEKIMFWVKKEQKITFVIYWALFFIVSIVFLVNSYNSKVRIPNLEEDVFVEVEETKKIDRVEEARNRLEKQLEEIELAEFPETYKKSSVAWMAAVKIKGWKELVEQCADFDDIEVQRLVQENADRITAVKEKEMSNVRGIYGQRLNKELWIDDYQVRVKGRYNDVLRITHHSFVVNMNILEFHVEMKSFFEDLEFKKIEYEWYKDASDYTLFEL